MCILRTRSLDMETLPRSVLSKYIGPCWAFFCLFCMFLMSLFCVCTLRTRSLDMETLPRSVLSTYIGPCWAFFCLFCMFLMSLFYVCTLRTRSLDMETLPRIARSEKAMFDTIAATNWSMLKLSSEAVAYVHIYIYKYVYMYIYVCIHVDRGKYAWVEVDWSMLKLSSEAVLCMLMCKLIERTPLPPGGCFLFTMSPDQEPCVRDFMTRCDGRILSWNLLHTALDQGTTQQTNPTGGGVCYMCKCAYT